MLDIFIQAYSPKAEKLVIRAKHTEIKSKKEITGYDALYFTKDNSDIYLWLGQAKAGQKKYCKTSILEDLNEKYKKDYFADTAFYIADKCDAIELKELLKDINRICYEAQKYLYSKDLKVNKLFELLKTKNVKIKIPCLIAYTKDIYTNSSLLKQNILNEIQEIMNDFDSCMFPIEISMTYDLVFYIFPVKDIDYIRQKIIDLKKEAT